jgi:hypothetical protein
MCFVQYVIFITFIIEMSHNLNVESYKFQELLDLFQLDNNNITVEELKRARKRVLMTHPDKSKLPPEYFLFYKKAFEIIVRMYDNVEKVSQNVENHEYVPEKSDASNKVFRKNIQNISPEVFHKQFNEIFEKHGTKKFDSSKNDWFTSIDAQYDETAQNQSQMNAALDRVKLQQQQMIMYKGVAPMQARGGNGYYEEDDNEYVECDPFSKLKFDDLRKVHKDQTVFSVRESDMANVPQYRSVDEYQRARTVGNVQPMERSHAENIIQEQERILQERIRHKQYNSELAVMRNIETNKQVMANFLKLT